MCLLAVWSLLTGAKKKEKVDEEALVGDDEGEVATTDMFDVTQCPNCGEVALETQVSAPLAQCRKSDTSKPWSAPPYSSSDLLTAQKTYQDWNLETTTDVCAIVRLD